MHDREGKVRMNKAKGPIDRIKVGLEIALLAALTGCAGWVDGGGGYGYGGYGYGGVVMAPEPDYYLFGGDYGWGGRDVYRYGRRGFESRRAAHLGRGGYYGGGFHGGGHGGGGFGGGGHGGHGGGGHGR